MKNNNNIKNKLFIFLSLLLALGSVAFAIFYFSADNQEESTPKTYNYSEGTDSNNNSNNTIINYTNFSDTANINGKISGCDNSWIILELSRPDTVVLLAKSKINEDGKFSMKVNISTLDIYALSIQSAEGKILKTIPLTLIPDDKINIETTFEKFDVEPNVDGVDWKKELNELMVLVNRNSKLNQQEIIEGLQQLTSVTMKEKPESPFILVLFNFMIPNAENIKNFENVVSEYETNFPSSFHTKNFKSMLTNIKPEFDMNRLDGSKFNMNDLKGKIVLVDFWASWCAPCRRSNPELVKLYKKYKSKGLEILSVSLDTDYNQWKSAISKDNLIWPNHISELQGFESSFVQLFNLKYKGIPNYLLLDRNGILIVEDLQDKPLEEFISKAINEK